MSSLLKNRFMISTIAFALLLVALVGLVIIPSFREIKIINRQVLEERMRLERLYTRGQLQKAVQQDYESIKEDAAFLDTIMLKENEELRYITAVEAAAERTGVDIEFAIGTSSRIPQRHYSELGVTITARGRWEQVLRFAQELETLPYYTNISELTASVRPDGRDDGGSRAATLTVKADTYWRIPSL